MPFLVMKESCAMVQMIMRDEILNGVRKYAMYKMCSTQPRWHRAVSPCHRKPKLSCRVGLVAGEK